MSTFMSITTGSVEAQYDISLPRPPLREGVLECWLAEQPEYRPGPEFWCGRHLLAEVFVDRREGALWTFSLCVSGDGTSERMAEQAALRRRLVDLAAQLGGRLWDDDAEGFVGC